MEKMSELGRVPATVMFTDWVGYSEATERDEAGALHLLNEHRGMVRPLLAEYGGREVKTIGDAFMVEFEDPLAAVRCALAIQQKHAERNRDPRVQEITLRIGLHAGEVLHQEGDLFGDTVNIASRIEPLAPPGGICFSSPVYDAVHARLDVLATPLGPATLKNIHLPVTVYRIDPRPERYLPIREGPWVDRAEELHLLEDALASAWSGQTRLILVSGEMGIGKTRLAERLVRLATRRGARVAWGRSSEDRTGSPYALWAEAVEGAAVDLAPGVLKEAAGEYAPELQHLLRGLELSTGAAGSGPVGDLDQARDRLFTGIARLFRELGRDQPIVLLLDDLQWADPDSARLLESLVRNLKDAPLLLLALYRSETEPAASVSAEVLARLAQEPAAGRIHLQSLSLDAVRQLVLASLKTKAIPDEFVRRIFEATGGNPYFVEEVIRSLRERRILSSEPGAPVPSLPEDLPLPDSVRRLVRQRLDRLDETMAPFLRTLAVLGQEFPLAPLARLTGLGPDELLDRLGAAVALGFLTERTDERGGVRYAFHDRLMRETLYTDTPVTRRVKDHRRVGEALEELQRSGERVPAAELAFHFQRAQAPDRALHYALLAAEEAGRLFAREEAVRQYRTALTLLGSRPDERARARVLEALGDHLYKLGQLEAGQAHRTDAIAGYERLGDLRAAGNLHRKIANAMREDPTSARHHWEEARRLLETGPETAELARLYVTIAGYRYEEGDTSAARELYGRAVQVARRVEDPTTQVSAEIVLAGLHPVTEADRVFDELAEALRIADERGLTDYLPNLHMVLALASLHIRGDGPGAERALDAALTDARRAQDAYSEKAIEGNLVTYVAWRLGEYARALRTVEAHLAYAAEDPRKLSATAVLVDADIALSRGEHDRAARDVEEAGALLEGDADWSERVHLGNVRGRTELRRGRPARALEALRGAHDLGVGAGVPALMAALHAETLHLEVDAALRLGDVGKAEVHLASLEELGARSGQPTVQAYATRARALRLDLAGDLAGELEALGASVSLWEKIGWGYELACSRLQLAGLFRRTGASERAGPLEELGRSFFARVGAVEPSTAFR